MSAPASRDCSRPPASPPEPSCRVSGFLRSTRRAVPALLLLPTLLAGFASPVAAQSISATQITEGQTRTFTVTGIPASWTGTPTLNVPINSSPRAAYGYSSGTCLSNQISLGLNYSDICLPTLTSTWDSATRVFTFEQFAYTDAIAEGDEIFKIEIYDSAVNNRNVFFDITLKDGPGPVISLSPSGTLGETGVAEGGIAAGFELRMTPTLPYDVHVAVLVREEGTAFDNGAPDPYPGHVLPEHRGEFVVTIPANAASASHFVQTRPQTFLEKDTTVHLLVLAPTAGVRSIVRDLHGVELSHYVTDGANQATITVLDGSDTASAVTPEVRLHVHPEDTEVAEGGTLEFWLALKPQPQVDLAVSIDLEDGVAPNSNVTDCGSFLADGQAGRRTVTVPGYGNGQPRQSWNWVRFTAQTVDDNVDETDCDVVATIATGSGYKVIEHEGVTITAQGRATVRVTDNDEAESSQDGEGHPKQDAEVVHPTVTLTSTTASVTEGADVAFTLSADRAPPDPLPVWVDYKETRGSGESYRATGGSAQVVIPRQGRSVTWTRTTEDDDVWLADGALTVSLGAGEGYQVGEPSAATVAIIEDDPQVELEESQQDEAEESTQDGEQESAQDEVETSTPVEADVAAAVAFWRERNNPAKLQYWLDIQAALTSGQVPDALMARVTDSWHSAAPGGRFYATWAGVYKAFTALRAAPELEPEQDPEPEQEPEAGDNEVEDARQDDVEDSSQDETENSSQDNVEDSTQDEAEDSTQDQTEESEQDNVEASTPPPATPTLSVADATAREGEDYIWFTVRLSAPSDAPVTVRYRTREATPVSARRNRDYLAADGTLTFAPDDTAQRFRVRLHDDGHDEGRETFEVVLSEAQGATLADGVAVGTIVNTDPLPAAYLGRLGRAGAAHVVDILAARFDTAGAGQGLVLGGQAVDPSSLPPRREASGPGVAAGAAVSHRTPAPVRPAGAAAGPARPATALERALWQALTQPGSLDLDKRFLSQSRFHLSLTNLKTRAQRNMTPAPAAGPDNEHVTLTPSSGDSVETVQAAPERPGHWSLWGRGALTRFGGRATDTALDGAVLTGLVGLDYARDRWLAGLALAWHDGDGDYRALEGESSGDLNSTLITVTPYLRYALTPGLSVWGTAGVGTGTLQLRPDTAAAGPQEAIKTDMSMSLGALGLKGRVYASASTELALKADALWVRTASGATDGLLGAAADTRRLRLLLAGQHRRTLANDARLTPSVELGLRYDGGDAETGLGMELGGGLRYADPVLGLTVETKARALIAHDDNGYEEWGLGGSLSLDPGRLGRGLALRLDSGWGIAESNAEALWQRQSTAGLAPPHNPAAHARLNAELGYGLDVPRTYAVLTPYGGLEWAGPRRALTLGWRFDLGQRLNLSVEGERLDTGYEDTDHSLMLRTTLPW